MIPRTVTAALNRVSHQLAAAQYGRIRASLLAELEQAQRNGATTEALLALLADRARQAPARASRRGHD